MSTSSIEQTTPQPAPPTTVPPEHTKSALASIGDVLRRNIRDSVMFVVLVVVVLIFAIWSQGKFISSYNLTSLIAQTCVVGVMACGMTLVIIVRHIDLSVGFACGFLGAIAAILMTSAHLPAIVAIIVVLAFGAVIGLGEGLLIGKVGIPAFVVTLGLMIAMHGLELLSTQKNGTIAIDNKFFLALSNGFIPPIFSAGGLKSGSTLVIGVIGLALFVFLQVTSRARQVRNHFAVDAAWWFVLKLVLVIAIVAFLVYKFATFNGISWALVILGAVVVLVATMQSRTRLGRHIYGLGGSPEAAELSGVNIVRVQIIIFVIMGTLVGLGGVLQASRMQSATTTAGTGFELLVIAGCFIGGCSPYGGVGKVIGSLIGALIMQSLVNGMSLMGIPISYQYIVQGAILVLAVLFDILSRKMVGEAAA
jgi:putative multiple sugar transport system permease protein